jgi:hypothetical protein
MSSEKEIMNSGKMLMQKLENGGKKLDDMIEMMKVSNEKIDKNLDTIEMGLRNLERYFCSSNVKNEKLL